MNSTYNHRYVAQVVLEASTALKVGSGESDLFIDTPVLKDWNGLPMILGASIAGVLRKSFRNLSPSLEEEIFGKENGSRILVSNAHLVDEKAKVHQGLGLENKNNFLKKYANLPIREHVAIDHRGVAVEGAKFDEEVVFAGSRFKCEVELIGNKEDEATWDELLSLLSSPLFRLGSGSTKGFGETKVVSCYQHTYTMGKDYDEKPSDLNVLKGNDSIVENKIKTSFYTIRIEPDDFFSFGSGFGDDAVDDIAVKEERVLWENEGRFSERDILLPASSLKGTLSHRVAFHYNALTGVYADQKEIETFSNYTGENNNAVSTLFGASKGHQNEGKGKTLFSDLYQDDRGEVKIFDHVKIDRFTGGTVNSALFNEKVIAQKDVWNIKIILADTVEDPKVIKAFENTLDDLCRGWLPLGGKVNRGHGVFQGVDETMPQGIGQNGWIKTEGGKEDVK